jgi:hypothetical protein
MIVSPPSQVKPHQSINSARLNCFDRSDLVVAFTIGILSLMAGAYLLGASENKPGFLKNSAAFFLINGIIFMVGWFFGIFHAISELMR